MQYTALKTDTIFPTNMTPEGQAVADAQSTSDYFPFGSPLPGRGFDGGSYRFGFNGVEKDNEIAGSDGTHYEFMFREYDSRIGRFWSIDPLYQEYPWNSTYAFAENRVIDGIDLEGKEFQPAGKPAQNVKNAAGEWTERQPAQSSTYLPQGANTGVPSENLPVQEPIPLPQNTTSVTAEYQRTMDAYSGINTSEVIYGKDGQFARTQVVPMESNMMDIAVTVFTLAQYGLAKLSVTTAAKGGMTELQLVTKAAQKAEAAIGGSGGVAGTLKHTYAKNLLSRYQSIYGDRGLSLGSNYFNGPAGKGFLDVVNHNTGMIYDFKFGNAFMSNAQYLKYSNSFPGYGIQVIRP